MVTLHYVPVRVIRIEDHLYYSAVGEFGAVPLQGYFVDQGSAARHQQDRSNEGEQSAEEDPRPSTPETAVVSGVVDGLPIGAV